MCGGAAAAVTRLLKEGIDFASLVPFLTDRLLSSKTEQRAKPVLLAVRDGLGARGLLGRGGLILNGRFFSRSGWGTNYLLRLVTVVVRLQD